MRDKTTLHVGKDEAKKGESSQMIVCAKSYKWYNDYSSE